MKSQIIGLLAFSTLTLLAGCSTKPAALVETAQSKDTLRIGGSAETYEALERLTEAYLAKTNHADAEFFPPSQTSGGILGVKNDVMDIGGVSRLLTDEEEETTLTYIPLIEAPLVIAIHNSVTGITNITGDQIKAIYKGEITNWEALGGPDASIALLDFTEDENEKQVLRKTYLGDELKITSNAIIFAEDDELLDMAAITEFSIAAIPLEDELEELPLKVLSIDGIAPSTKNIQSGDYPMSLSLGMVMSTTASPIATSFAEFVADTEGQQILKILAD